MYQEFGLERRCSHKDLKTKSTKDAYDSETLHETDDSVT